MTMPNNQHAQIESLEKYRRAHLSILLRVHQQLREVLVPFLLVITCFSPRGDGFSVEDENVEEGVEKKDGVGFDGDGIKEDSFWRNFEVVRHKRWLNHHKRVVDIFRVEDVSGE